MRTPAPHLRSRTRQDRGAVIPLVALVLPVVILMTAFAVDLGRQRDLRRTMQARADMVSLDLVRDVAGRGVCELIGAPDIADALAASAQRNEITVSEISGVVWGLDEAGQFTPLHEPNQTVPAENCDVVPNAVRILTSDTIDYAFQPGTGEANRSAVASVHPVASIFLGSMVAGIHPQVDPPSSVEGQLRLEATVGALNAQLGARFGSSLPNPQQDAGFDAVGYRGLAAGDVELDRMAAALGFGSTDELLDSDITVGELFSGAITALDSQAADGDPNAADAAFHLDDFQSRMQVDSTSVLRLGDVFEVDQGSPGSAAGTRVNAYDLLTGSAQAIDGTNFLSFDFTPNIPGITVTNVQMATIEQVQWARGGVTTSANTAQVRLQINLELNPSTVLANAPVRVPLVIEAARADAEITRLACTSPLEDSEAEAYVATGAIRVRLGTATDLAAEGGASITAAVMFAAGDLTIDERLTLLLSTLFSGNITGQAGVTLGGGTSDHVFFPFDPPDEWQRAMGGVGSSIGGGLESTFDTSLLLDGTLALLLGTGSLQGGVNQAFEDVLQNQLIDPLLQAAGVSIGGADVLVKDLDCGGVRLID
jgi:uncharacterized membrane protein